MRITLQPAFVLHARPFRDTSLLVDLLTGHHGRVHVIARSARGLRSRYRGLLQPFTPFLASWSGKTELLTLNGIEPNGAPYLLFGTALINGFYLNELLVHLLHRYDPHAEIYTIYQHALAGLQQEKNSAKILRMFEKKLLNELGYGLTLDREVNGKEIIADAWYQCDPQRGFFRNYTALSQKNIFQGKTLLALHHNNLDTQEHLQAAKRLMRMLLTPLLGNTPIRSRELFVRQTEEEEKYA